jgi:hypothetical protein
VRGLPGARSSWLSQVRRWFPSLCNMVTERVRVRVGLNLPTAAIFFRPPSQHSSAAVAARPRSPSRPVSSHRSSSSQPRYCCAPRFLLQVRIRFVLRTSSASKICSWLLPVRANIAAALVGSFAAVVLPFTVVTAPCSSLIYRFWFIPSCHNLLQFLSTLL